MVSRDYLSTTTASSLSFAPYRPFLWRYETWVRLPPPDVYTNSESAVPGTENRFPQSELSLNHVSRDAADSLGPMADPRHAWIMAEIQGSPPAQQPASQPAEPGSVNNNSPNTPKLQQLSAGISVGLGNRDSHDLRPTVPERGAQASGEASSLQATNPPVHQTTDPNLTPPVRENAEASAATSSMLEQLGSLETMLLDLVGQNQQFRQENFALCTQVTNPPTSPHPPEEGMSSPQVTPERFHARSRRPSDYLFLTTGSPRVSLPREERGKKRSISDVYPDVPGDGSGVRGDSADDPDAEHVAQRARRDEGGGAV